MNGSGTDPARTAVVMRKKEMSNDVLVCRVGTVKEIAALMVFLTGEDAGYITAATSDINGGLQVP